MEQILERLPEFLASPIGKLSLLMLALGLVILSFATLRYWHKRLIASGAHPVLLGMVDEAILKAYRASDMMFEDIGVALHGFQKKELADKLYQLLPSPVAFFNVGPIPISLDWKMWVSQSDFSGFVQTVYDEALEDWDAFAWMAREDMRRYADSLQGPGDRVAILPVPEDDLEL